MMKKILTIAMMGAVLASCTEQKPVDVEGQWNIVTLNGKTLEAEKTPYVGFDTEAGKLYGNSGCNYIHGTFDLSEENIIKLGHVASTMMSCPDMTLEQEALATLEKVSKVEATENGLDLCDAEGAKLIGLAKRFNAVAFAELAGQWNMVKVAGRAIPEDLDGTPFLAFTAEKTVAGLAGYNNINGEVVLDEAEATAIQFQNMASTRKMGPNMEFEDSVLKALESIRNFGLLANGHLALFDANGNLAIELAKAD